DGVGLGEGGRSGDLRTGRRVGLVPGLAAVIGALNDLAEPVVGLRHVNALGIQRRTLQVIEIPTAKVRTADVPLLPLAVRSENEGSFTGADQDADRSHRLVSPYADRKTGFLWPWTHSRRNMLIRF